VSLEIRQIRKGENLSTKHQKSFGDRACLAVGFTALPQTSIAALQSGDKKEGSEREWETRETRKARRGVAFRFIVFETPQLMC